MATNQNSVIFLSVWKLTQNVKHKSQMTWFISLKIYSVITDVHVVVKLCFKQCIDLDMYSMYTVPGNNAHIYMCKSSQRPYGKPLADKVNQGSEPKPTKHATTNQRHQ